jgi:ethanolamine transporter EutH
MSRNPMRAIEMIRPIPLLLFAGFKTMINGITWLTNALMHISNNIGLDHLGATNLIPLASSTCASFMLGLVRG